jgi:ribosomal protein L37E
MSTKHIRTTGDLMRFGAALKVTCRDCGSAKTFSGVHAVMTFGNVPLWHTEERLKCSRCGKRAAKVEALSPV